MKKKSIRKMVLSALFLALGLVLPYITGQIPEIGQMLLPMHIPVFICGFVCGPLWGAAVGVICPVMRSLLTGGFPPMWPTAVSMAFELLTYGAVSGALYRVFPRKTFSCVSALVLAMAAGRIVWGSVRLLMTVGTDSTFPWSVFIAGAFTSAVPGIVLQVILVPVIVYILEKNKLIEA